MLVYAHVGVCKYACTCSCVCTFKGVYTCRCVHVQMWEYMPVSVCTYRCGCTLGWVCVHVDRCVHMRVGVHMWVDCTHTGVVCAHGVCARAASPWCCHCCRSGSCSPPPASPSAQWPTASPGLPRGSGWWPSRWGHPHQGTGGHLEATGGRESPRIVTSACLGGFILSPAWALPLGHGGGGAGGQQTGRQGDTRAQQSTHPPSQGNPSGLGQNPG